MAPWRCSQRAVVPGLVRLAVCLAAAIAGPRGMPQAVAQAVTQAGSQAAGEDDGLVYSKQLDLALNPTRDGDEPQARAETGVPAPAHDDSYYDKPLKLRSISSDAGTQNGGGTRVINGTPSRQGAWRSTVNIAVRRGFFNPSTGNGFMGNSSCGGAVIDSRWVLTAAHCLFDARLGGLKRVEWVTVYEDSQQYRRGRAVRVEEVHVHRRFKVLADQLTHDIALLKLEKDSAVPRQKLAAYRGASAYPAEGMMATVVGWGRTDPDRGSPSPILLQANVPIVAQQACQSLYPAIGDVAFCAGYPQGGTDTCQGDSGGPLLVAGSNGEPVQAGITSFGKGCAQPNAYGAYTNLGLFEGWIKERVPNPDFVMPGPHQPAAPLAGIAGAGPGSPPAPNGQVSVDVRIVRCARRNAASGAASANPAANRIKLGSCIRVDVTSGVAGQLAVFSRNASGKVEQLFPNRLSASRQVGATPGSVQAGRTISIPGPGDGFDFMIGTPLGRAEIIAIVVPESVGLPATAGSYRGVLRSVDSFDDELAALAREVAAKAGPGTPRAVGTRQYEVIE